MHINHRVNIINSTKLPKLLHLPRKLKEGESLSVYHSTINLYYTFSDWVVPFEWKKVIHIETDIPNNTLNITEYFAGDKQ
jgi:hypothetical protein